MNSTERLDVFKSVHKGLRKSLFELALQAGILDPSDPGQIDSLVRNGGEVFRFLEHHSLNEDRFLIPIMEAKSMPEASGLKDDHAGLEAQLEDLRRGLAALAESGSGAHAFYLALNHFIAGYLLHIHDEENRILPRLHECLSDAELAAFSRDSVASTAPRDQEMMLSRMFPAMTPAELREFFSGLRGKASPEAVRFLEALAERVLGGRSEILRERA